MDSIPVNNRRSYVRVYFPKNIVCSKVIHKGNSEITNLTEPLKFQSTDLSLGGIGVIVGTPFEEDDMLIFSYEIDNINYEISGRVIYCLFDGTEYHMGLGFVSPDEKLLAHIKRIVTRLSFGGLK